MKLTGLILIFDIFSELLILTTFQPANLSVKGGNEKYRGYHDHDKDISFLSAPVLKVNLISSRPLLVHRKPCKFLLSELCLALLLSQLSFP